MNIIRVFVEVLPSNRHWLELFETRPKGFIAGLCEGGVVLVNQPERADVIVGSRGFWTEEFADRFVLIATGDDLTKLDTNVECKLGIAPVISTRHPKLGQILPFHNHIIYSDKCEFAADRHAKQIDLFVNFGLGEVGTNKYAHRADIQVLVDMFKDDPFTEITWAELDPVDYCEKLSRAKVTISPFGHVELCGRDYQAAMYDTIILKPHCEYIAKPDPTLGCLQFSPRNIKNMVEFAITHYDELLKRTIENNENIRYLRRNDKAIGIINAGEFYRFRNIIRR